ncbi:MAG: SDR family oxidoreductase, partial [Alphaproteobacteria bacterium]|nr:SDR family oxidoreductase [Alphaproteobacteria bacterium]
MSDLDRFTATNRRAVLRFARMAVREMLPAERGAIINTASVLEMTGFVGSSAYAATRSALVGLTYQMAADDGARGLSVNAIAPGVIRTGMTARNIDTNAGYRVAMIDATPVPAPGEPDDIPYTALFLASRAAKFVHFHVLVVDGGWLTTHDKKRWRRQRLRLRAIRSRVSGSRKVSIVAFSSSSTARHRPAARSPAIIRLRRLTEPG